MLKQPFMKKASLAIAITAALMLGGAAQAQTAPAGVATPGGAMSQTQQGNLPAGTTKPQNNAVTPAPTAGTGATGTSPSSGMSGSGAMTKPGSVAGTTKSKDNIVDPAPMAGTAKSAEMRDSKVKKSSKKHMRNKSTSGSSKNDMGAGNTSTGGTK